MPRAPRQSRLRAPDAYKVDPQKVIAARFALGLRQGELAQRARISQSLLCDIENGRRNGSPATHKLLASALRLRRIADLYESGELT